ncbi:zinc finger protein with KRAB and SCAN domains 8-like [Anopheles moucheti]|uniref:zinc finger protein with KRAB and SCAN domains 8-like n=1 Tax=Anopheles moucheti TaxID=186751 RepID=UPI0022F06BD6|nr:zinc finger protein with KRAB and SCAN domains 8-like [Anopheles moucheti]
MSSTSEMDYDSPFVKKENSCKICGENEGPMESIFCKADDTALLNKIYKCTRVKVTPVCGLISPICEYCHRRIDEFDENALPKVVEFVIKTELEPESLDYDPLNVGNMVDPMAIDVKSEDDLEAENPTKRRGRKRAINVQPRSRTVRKAGRPRLSAESKKVQNIVSKARGKKPSVDDGSTDENVEVDHSVASAEPQRSQRERISPQDNDKIKSSDFESDFENGNESALEEESDQLSNSDEEPVKRGRLKRGYGVKAKKPKRADSPKQCEVCGKQVQYMREHMRLHRIESQHPCPHCDRTFVQANNLKYHIRKHLGEKPYACKQCKKEFYCEAHLKSHMRVHGPQGLFQCSMCPKSFNQECNLKKHLRVHTGEKPYVCDKCGKRFNSTSNLRNHARLHSDERPLTCDHCSKSFVDVHHLQRHIRVHTGERPYICHVCFQAYYCQTGLMDHLKTHIEKKSFKLD